MYHVVEYKEMKLHTDILQVAIKYKQQAVSI